MPRLRPFLAALLLLAGVRGARAQVPLGADPAHTWRTITTAHFRIHHRAEHARWALDVASRIEAVRGEVVKLVGYTPPLVVDVVIDDPVNGSNGVALPDLRGPAMFFWPTPPDPATAIGHHPGWGELLAVHEFAHVAHLSRPARDPWEKLVMALQVVPNVAPIPRRAPAWVTEGYATVIEGILSGSGRPNGTWRAAVLREWALEGQLPAYGGLDDDGPFMGGSLRYLVGSAFLEWLVQQRGDSALPQLWRRLTARQARSFDAAFRGTFGDSPAAMYAQFKVDVTARALEAKKLREAPGLSAGTLVARLERGVGAPAVSRDGARLALMLSPMGAPSRIEVWRTDAAPADSAEEIAKQRALERDPEDVADWSPWPRRPTAVATLWPVRGRAHENPRFMPDGRTLLVTRQEPLPGGGSRPDLFWWDPRSDALRRVTRGAGIRYADPTPDGLFAVGVRCDAGWCDVVEVRLADGGVRVLAEGNPRLTYSGARLSPSGDKVASARQERGHWWPVIITRATGTVVAAGPDDAVSRYAPTFVDGEKAIVVTSEASGVPELERIDLATNATRPITRGLGAALHADAAGDGRSLWYLALHARGLDLRRLAVDSMTLAEAAPLRGPAPTGGLPPGPLAPAVAPAAAAPIRAWPFADVKSDPYGRGPIGWRLVPTTTVTIGAITAGMALHFTDLVGRFSATTQGIVGDATGWRGGGAAASWRGRRPSLDVHAWITMEEPSHGIAAVPGSRALDLEHVGAAVSIALRRSLGAGTHTYRAGIVGGTVSPLNVSGAVYSTRLLAFGELAQSYRQQRRGTWLSSESLTLQASVGATDGIRWSRVRADGSVSTGSRDVQLRFEGTYGRVSSSAPASEQFTIGGVMPPLMPAYALSQRLAVPALAAGSLGGTQAVRGRGALESGAFTLFFDAIATGAQSEHASDYWRLAGVEARQSLDPISIVRVPGLDLRIGAAYVYDGPDANRWRGWLSFTVRP